MSTKNNIANRNPTQKQEKTCPVCGEDMRVVKYISREEKGMFWYCSKGDYKERHKKS